MNENMEVLNVSSVKPIIDEIETQEIIDINEEEWHNDVVVNASSEKDENFDIFFDDLKEDVEGASTLISEILEKKKNIKDNEENIYKERENFNLEKIELEKRRLSECVKLQKMKLQEEEAQIKADIDVMNKELTLKEQSLKNEEQKLKSDKEQFDKYKEVEENKLLHDQEKLEVDRKQLERDKELNLQKLENYRKELEIDKEQFENYKKVEEEKLSLEQSNLNQRCERFKKIVEQFNKNFAKLPEE